jgi:K+-sensing histidine kinase KdpD
MGAEHAKRLQQLAEEAQGFRTRLLELVGHDLHQPLGALRYYLTALRYETLTLEKPAAERLGKISARIDLVNKQVTDMLNKALELAQLDNAEVVARCRSQPISPLVQELRDRFAGEARMQGIALRFYGTDGMLVHDPALMSAVLRNLVGNALRYHNRVARQPRVIVAFRQGGHRIDILDNGGGIAAEFEAQLNAPQFDRQLARPLGHGRGLGLGLAIARQFADKQGWQMQIHNQPVAGVWFQLTHVQAPITDPGSAADAEKRGAGGSLPKFDIDLERGATS